MTDGKLHHRSPDLTGQTFGALTALRPGSTDGKSRKWIFRCECGKECEKGASDVKKDANKGRTPNCGCMTKELQGANKRTHGMTGHPAYAVWRSMLARCMNPNHHAWKNYGARGVMVCDRWIHSFENFWADMGPTYAPGLELDRRDNNAGYFPENCRWVSRQVNTSNRRTSVLVGTPWGRLNVAEAARRSGIGVTTILYRLDHGWPEEELFRKPDPRNRFTTS